MEVHLINQNINRVKNYEIYLVRPLDIKDKYTPDWPDLTITEKQKVELAKLRDTYLIPLDDLIDKIVTRIDHGQPAWDVMTDDEKKEFQQLDQSFRSALDNVIPDSQKSTGKDGILKQLSDLEYNIHLTSGQSDAASAWLCYEINDFITPLDPTLTPQEVATFQKWDPYGPDVSGWGEIVFALESHDRDKLQEGIARFEKSIHDELRPDSISTQYLLNTLNKLKEDIADTAHFDWYNAHRDFYPCETAIDYYAKVPQK